MGVIKHKAYFFAFSAITLALALFAIFFWGLKLGIDFTGGSLMEVAYEVTPASSFSPTVSWVEEAVGKAGFTNVRVQPTGEHGFILRTTPLADEQHQSLLTALDQGGEQAKLTEKRFNSIGPTIGKELRQKALYTLLFIVAALIIFIAIAFRKVSDPVPAWKYGVIAILTLLHDVIIPTGVFAWLARFGGFEVDTLFVTALLAILGLSVNDTIVVFDRVRENLTQNKALGVKEPFEETVGKSLSQTYLRSFNTSLMVIIVLLTLYFFGGESTRDFSLVLSIGMIAGTYSSIILASPLLVVANRKLRS